MQAQLITYQLAVSICGKGKTAMETFMHSEVTRGLKLA